MNTDGLVCVRKSHKVLIALNLYRLTLSQIDDLWNCLAEESKYSEHFFVWLISQLKTKDQHALSEEVFRHIFNRKLPSLAPELVSMQALNLFQQLCNVARNSKEEDREAALESVHYLWKIALFAKSTGIIRIEQRNW